MDVPLQLARKHFTVRHSHQNQSRKQASRTRFGGYQQACH